MNQHPQLKITASRIRAKVVEMSHKAGTPHLGSSLSCVDILSVLYWNVLLVDPKTPKDENRDRFILSKGHAAPALYAALAYRGFFPEKVLDTFNQNGSSLAEQPGPNCIPGLELATGSLGHGLSAGIGMALAAVSAGRSNRVFVLMSDGECNEGSVWEAALFAPVHKLERLVVVIDYNRWQATGRTNEIVAMDPLAQKWKAFGWSAYTVNGHDFSELIQVLSNVPDGSGKPVAVIANTVKGKGVSFMEDDNNWHYRSPNAEELKKARHELGVPE